jgi:hypothetical protein
MKITDVKTTTLKGYKDWDFVKIETDEGVFGIGEAHPGEGITDVVKKRLRPMILGKDPLNVEPLYTSMIYRSPGNASGGTLVGAIGVSRVHCGIWRGRRLAFRSTNYSVENIGIGFVYMPTWVGIAMG